MNIKSLLPFTVCAAFLAPCSLFAEPALTIYNQNFAVVRDTVPLDLKAGVNDVSFADVTAQAETDSVILRDPSGKVSLQVLEQSYRNDPVSQAFLLSLNEGKTIDFFVHEPNKADRVVQGKIIRSGHSAGSQAQAQVQAQLQPIIEVDGKLQFSLPGEPLFPSLGDDTVLNPTLSWKLNASEACKLDAELAYVTAGLSWHADYNVVAPEKSDVVDIIGWVTFDNQSGKTFRDAKIKLMAGDVNKLQPPTSSFSMLAARASADGNEAPPVTEKAFDEYHLYTLQRPVTLRDREAKQVEFVRAAQVSTQRIYIYDGAKIDNQQWRSYSDENIRGNSSYGTESNPNVWVMREFRNSEANHLGIPLPAGRIRFYSKDGDQLEFIGENEIDHTPKDETLRIFTGNAFDLKGERKRVDFKTDNDNHWEDESFEIKVRNHKTEPAEIRVVEHMYRAANWEISRKSNTFLKTDDRTIEFRIPLKPDEEQKITYTVHYSW